MDKPFGLEKIYLFPSPFPKLSLKVSLGWNRQINLTLRHQGSVKSVLIKSYHQDILLTIQQWSCIGLRADPQMTRKYISYQSCDIPYCHYQSLYREHFKLSPLQLLYLKERGYSWKQGWEFRQLSCMHPRRGCMHLLIEPQNTTRLIIWLPPLILQE